MSHTYRKLRLGKQMHSSALQCCLSVWLLGCLLLIPEMSFGQVPNSDDEGEAGGSSILFGDSVATDTAVTAQKDVRIKTLRIRPDLMQASADYAASVKFDLDKVGNFDRLERTDGFSIELGQIGKPYRRYRYGVNASLLQTGIPKNQYTGQEDLYFLDPETDVRYYNTRTPFINAYYGQGKVDQSALVVDVSQNVNPWWNLSVGYRRDKAEGSYLNFVTDHYQMYLATYFRTRNNKYHLFVNGMFQELNDQLNGGVSQLFAYDDSFGKSSQPVALDGAGLKKLNRSLHLKHFYLITSDSASNPHQIRIFNSVTKDYFRNQFTDGSINTDVQSYTFPLYRTLGDSTFFYERFTSRTWRIKEGVSYRFDQPRFEMGHQFYAQQEFTGFEKNEVDRNLNVLTLVAKGEVIHRPKPYEARFDYHLRQGTSNLFDPQAYYEGKFTLSMPNEKLDYARKVEGEDGFGQNPKDSVVVSHFRRPLSLWAGAIRSGLNPSLQQAYGAGWAGNNFASDSTLRNQKMELFRLGMVLRGKDEKTKYGSLKGHRLELTGFTSTQRSMIAYDSTLALRQFSDGDPLRFIGVEAKGRFRYRSWSVEASVVAQTGSSRDTTLENLFVSNQPNLYGKAGIYWEKHDLKIARAIRAGIECNAFLDYNTPLFDPASQQFYPQARYTQPGYFRIDAFFSAQVKRAQLFLRMYHANEGITLPGYFTTLYYPMWDRTFMVGFNWSFFD